MGEGEERERGWGRGHTQPGLLMGCVLAGQHVCKGNTGCKEAAEMQVSSGVWCLLAPHDWIV